MGKIFQAVQSKITNPQYIFFPSILFTSVSLVLRIVPGAKIGSQMLYYVVNCLLPA